MDGGIFGLLGLISTHRGAVEYDWRTRFHLSLADVGEGMSLAEAARLATILRGDPSSMIAAALEGWDHPVSREALILMDQFDLDMAVNAGKKKPQPHPGRPWKVVTAQREQVGNTGGRSQEEITKILTDLGHKLPPV